MDNERNDRNPVLPRLLLVAAIVVALIAGVMFIADSGVRFQDIDGPRLVALIAILLFVGAGVLARPLSSWQILRSMVAWIAIILVVAGLYASRDELAGFAGRLLGALAPGMPITGVLNGDGPAESVAFVRSSDGHFAVRTEVNGASVPMLLDTGASFVTLSGRDARHAGIDTDLLSYVVPIRTANGMMMAASVTLDRIHVGPIERRNIRALVAPPGSLAQSLLGLSFLNELHGYSIVGDRLVLLP